MLKQLSLLFLKLGVLAFGGPAAHTAMMNEEVVEKRKWFTQREFLDLMTFTNLIPGPNSTELAILIGYKKAGLKGLFVSGVFFILPAVLIVIVFTLVYMTTQNLPYMQHILNGMIPIMITIILSASLKMSKKTLLKKEDKYLLLFAFLLLLFNTNEFLVLIFTGLLKLLVNNSNKLFVIEPFSLSLLFLTFLKIGSLLFGSGYALVFFLSETFVNHLGWLSQQELLNLVMIGEMTPGPIFTTATAIGFYLYGILGALLATVAIFLPSFVLIALLYPFFESLKSKPSLQLIISGISIASLALMFNVSISLIIPLFKSPLSLIILLMSLLASYRFKVNNFVLILCGALFGFIAL